MDWKIGKYSVVKKCVTKKITVYGEFLVKKKGSEQVYMARLYPIEEMKKDEVTQLLNDIRILCSIDHPNILKYFESFVVESEGTLCVVIEYCDYGSLRDILDKRMEKFNSANTSVLVKEDIAMMFIQLLAGLKELLRFGLIHCNLNPSNIVMNGDGAVKITDFTHVQAVGSVYPDRYGELTDYVCPEIFMGKQLSPRSDVWSLGVILWELKYNILPFKSKTRDETIKKALSLNFNKTKFTIGKESRSTLLSMLKLDPSERISISDLLSGFTGTKFMNIVTHILPDLKDEERDQKAENISPALLEIPQYDHTARELKMLESGLKNLRADRVNLVLKGKDDLDDVIVSEEQDVKTPLSRSKYEPEFDLTQELGEIQPRSIGSEDESVEEDKQEVEEEIKPLISPPIPKPEKKKSIPLKKPKFKFDPETFVITPESLLLLSPEELDMLLEVRERRKKETEIGTSIRHFANERHYTFKDLTMHIRDKAKFAVISRSNKTKNQTEDPTKETNLSPSINEEDQFFPSRGIKVGKTYIDSEGRFPTIDH